MAVSIFLARLFAQRRNEDQQINILRRKLRDNSNIFEMPEQMFLSNYRMDKHCFMDLLEDVAPHMKVPERSTAIPPTLKLGAFLRFLAAGSCQAAVGNEYMASMTQAKVSQILSECLDIFERHICRKWIQFEMPEEEEDAMKEKFYNKYGIPGVIGCVDGTHIRIIAPDDLRHLYYNRKGFYSINALMICDFDMVIRYVDATVPGANHDAFAWRTSAADGILKAAHDRGKRNTWLLGDSGYQNLPYLMTPYRTPQSHEAVVFNSKLCKARNVVERCFGTLKNRFRCIIGERGLHYSPLKATKIVNACCALHNMCIFKKNNWAVAEVPVEEIEVHEMFVDDEGAPSTLAAYVRDQLALAVSH